MRANISRSILSIFTALVLLAAVVATSAYARTSRNMVVDVPFDFTVAGRLLPAGQYQVERSTQASAEGLSLRSTDGSAGVFVLTSAVQSNSRQSGSRLVFTRYQDRYFLSQLWTSGETAGRALVKSESERTLERELVRAGSKPERVSIIVAQK